VFFLGFRLTPKDSGPLLVKRFGISLGERGGEAQHAKRKSEEHSDLQSDGWGWVRSLKELKC
jgi:hypothetical protein